MKTIFNFINGRFTLQAIYILGARHHHHRHKANPLPRGTEWLRVCHTGKQEMRDFGIRWVCSCRSVTLAPSAMGLQESRGLESSKLSNEGTGVQKNFVRTLLLGIILLLPSPALHGATPSDISPEKVDVEMCHLLDHLHDVGSKLSDEDGDDEALGKANNSLRSYIMQAARDPKLLSAPLQRVTDLGMHVATSPDKMLRIYSWDRQTGGSMHFFASIAQLHRGNELQCRVIDLSPNKEGDCGEFCKEIKVVHTLDGKTVYLIQAYSILSTMSRATAIEAYLVNNGTFTKAPIFQNRKKCFSEIGCDTSDTVEFPVIKIQDRNKMLLVPLIDKNGHQTGKYLVYKFNGYKFVFQPHRT